MQVLTNGKRRLVTTALVAGSLTVGVPVAAADSGYPADVVERAVAAKLSEPSFQGAPDAIERALIARQAEVRSGFQGSPDAFERAAAAREAQIPFQGSPDARDRMREAQRVTSVAPDAFERALISRSNVGAQAIAAPASPESGSTAGLDWSDFGLGAGAGIGLVLVLGGIGAGLLMRQGRKGIASA